MMSVILEAVALPLEGLALILAIVIVYMVLASQFNHFVHPFTIMIALPVPSVLLTVAHSISFGWRPALATVGGATVGIAVQLVVAAVGLTSLLNVVADAFEWLRWAGAAYLADHPNPDGRSLRIGMNGSVSSSLPSGNFPAVRGDRAT